MKNQRDPKGESPTQHELDQLPDIANLRAVQDALWKTDERQGAAVMVGAGLTRTAQRAAHNAPLPPLWRDLADKMEADLYPAEGAPANPLALAQEYEDTRGRYALDNLIRTRINDHTLDPGPLHKALLELPWTDILSTNWDTLLERTRHYNIDQHYEHVITATDIPRTKAPRIIKLHGTLPTNGPFIITEEDFRTYPQTNAPFVNLAQQILMENTLCLIGFSGDDPNFIQWTGWVRDNLGKHARPIYLAGALNLAPPAKQRLENRGVKTIDLTPLLKESGQTEPHTAALEIFLDVLNNARPWPQDKWPTRPRHEQEKQKQQPLTKQWRVTRKNYPGWIIAPRTTRISIKCETRTHEKDTKTILATGTIEERHAHLYEYAWRLDIALQPLNDIGLEIAEQDIIGLLEEATIETTLEQHNREELACWLLRHARETEDEDQFIKWQRWIENNMPQLGHRVAWERCLRARDELDLNLVERLLPRINGEDPIWGLRRAALHATLNNKTRAVEEGLATLNELRERQTRDRNSIWIASRRAWAHTFCQAAGSPWDEDERINEALGDYRRTLPLEFTAMRCDPQRQGQGILDELEQALKQIERDRETIEHPFDPAEETTVTHHLSQPTPTAHLQARRLYDQTGIPRKILNVNITHEEQELATRIEGTTSPTRITRMVSNHPNIHFLNEQLSRVAVAQLAQTDVDKTIEKLKPALADTIRRFKSVANDDDRWKERDAWAERASDIADAFSRLLVRSTPATIKQAVTETITTINDTPPQRELSAGLKRLLIRGLTTLPQDERATFLLDAIELPLPGEHDEQHPDPNLPEAIDTFTKPTVDRSPEAQRWTTRVDELIRLVPGRELTRERAIYRLLELHTWNLLTDEEQRAFANVLWEPPANVEKLPTATKLFAHVFLYLPEPTPGIARQAFEHEVVELNKAGQPTTHDLVAILSATRHNPDGSQYHLSRPQAQHWLSRITDRLGNLTIPAHKDPLNGPTQDERFTEWVGRAVAGAVLPAVTGEDITDEVAHAFLASEAPGVVVALPGLAILKPSLRDGVIDRLRHLLVGTEQDWGYAAAAVLEWSRSDVAEPLAMPGDLASLVTGAVVARNKATLANTLGAAIELVRQSRLTANDLARLESGLAYLYNDLDYTGNRVSEYAEVSQLRAQCAKLAYALKIAGRSAAILDEWLTSAKHDPLPDVRHAISENETK